MSNLRRPLIASIVLNVFLLGTIVGGLVSLKAPRSHPVGNLRQAVRQLPEPDRQAFQKVIRATRLNLRSTFREGRQARREAASLLEQPKLDTTALLAALERARTADVTIRTRLEQRIVAFAATSSPSVRRLLGESIARHVRDKREKN